MSTYGYKQTFIRLVNYVCFTPKSGHSLDFTVKQVCIENQGLSSRAPFTCISA